MWSVCVDLKIQNRPAKNRLKCIVTSVEPCKAPFKIKRALAPVEGAILAPSVKISRKIDMSPNFTEK